MNDTGVMERRSGVALWRQIADRIRHELREGLATHEGKLPPEMELAVRFGVNRHTVRAAIRSLIDEGILRAEQGRGTFVQSRPKLAYPIRRRTRFSEGLSGQARKARGILLAHEYLPAAKSVAEQLGLNAGDQILRLETLSFADGWPVSRAISHFDAARFEGLERHFEETGSITASFRRMGLEDYTRRETSITAQHAESADLEHLKLSPGAIILVTQAVNVDGEGKPVQYSLTRFAADRVELQVDGREI